MPTLCLNMIVKNEMANLERCLSAVAPYISCWVIGDTGSTDGTQEFIERFFAERGIPGELHSFPFENFAQARNEALEWARASKLKFDYILFTDADMEFVADDPHFANTLKHAAYKLLQRAGVSYWNLRLLRRSTPAQYRGVTHEFLDIRSGTTENLQNASYIDHGTGANRFEKYERDARLLNNAIAAETDTAMIARYTFYLANTLRDSGQKEAALDTYKKRAEQGHWQQEVFISLLNVAKIKEELLHTSDEVLAAYEQASRVCPSRAEALHAAALYCREKNLYREGYDAAKRGLTINYPTDALFVEDWVYEYGLLDELAINAYWCGKYAEAADACDQLLKAGKLPTTMRDRVEANRRYSVERLAESGIPEALRFIADRDQLFGALTPSDRNWMKLWTSARAYKDAGDEERFRRTALAAFQKRPRRGEPLYDLARYFREQGRYAESIIFAEQGLALYSSTDEQPLGDLFCIVGLHEELSIALNYSHDPEQRKRGFAACDWLSLARCVPGPQRALARSNLRFYVEGAAASLPSFQTRQMPFFAPEGYLPSNPSITRRNQELFVAQRCVNYTLTEHNEYETTGDEPIKTRNFLLKLDADFQLQSSQEILLPADLPEPKSETVRGFEDLRLFEWRGALWCSAAVLEFSPDNRAVQVLSRIDAQDGGTCRLAEWSVMTVGGEARNEKNWMPWVDATADGEASSGLRFVYLCDPTTLIDPEGQITDRYDAPISAEQFRGGSQAIPFGSGRLALIHEVLWIPQENRRRYHHRFVWFDDAHRLGAVSRPFFLQKQGVEFAAGLAWHQDDQRILISFAMDDGASFIADVQARDIRQNLIPALPFPSALTSKRVDGTPQSPFSDTVQLSPPASFSSLAPYLRSADSPRDRRDLSRPYDSTVFEYLDADKGRGLPQIHCFYEVFDETAEHRSLYAATRSMRAAGHPVQVWSYSPSKLNFLLGNGVELRDAADVIPRKFFDRVVSKAEIRYFSDIFRYAVLYERGGLWMDGDVIMLRPFGFRGQYFFNLQWKDGGKGHFVCGNVIFARARSPHMRTLYERAVSIFTSSHSTDFGDIGPKLLSDYIASPEGGELRNWLFSPVFFNSIDWTEIQLLDKPLISMGSYLNDDRVIGVHLWNARTHSVSDRSDGTLLSVLSKPEQHLPSLIEVFDRFAIDRNRHTGNRHFYARIYDLLLSDRRFAISDILEIGLQSEMQSGEAWRAYFPFCRATILSPNDIPNRDDMIRVVNCDVRKPNAIHQFAQELTDTRFDAIIDNGSHGSLDQQAALAALFPRLSPGGWYFIESLDWQPLEENGQRVAKTKELLKEVKTHGSRLEVPDPADIASVAGQFEHIYFFDSLYELGRANLTGGLVAIKKRRD